MTDLISRPPMLFNPKTPMPPTQTALGFLEMVPTSADLLVIPGEPFNDELYAPTLEFMDTITITSDNTFNNVLALMEPLSLCRRGDTIPDSNEAMPIWLLKARSATYTVPIPKIVLSAIKCMAAPCEIGIAYIPLSYPLVPGTQTDTNPTNPNFLPKTLMNAASLPTYVLNELANLNRMPKLIWDLAASDTFTIDLSSFTTAGVKLERFATGFEGGSSLNASYGVLPYENYSSGAIVLFLHQPYLPGSIFPTTFDINIYKSFTQLDTFVFQSPLNVPIDYDSPLPFSI